MWSETLPLRIFKNHNLALHQYEAIAISWPKLLHGTAVHSETAATSGLKILYERRKWSNESYILLLNSLHALQLYPTNKQTKKSSKRKDYYFEEISWVTLTSSECAFVKAFTMARLSSFWQISAFLHGDRDLMKVWSAFPPHTCVGRAFTIACLRLKWHCWFLIFWGGWPLYQKADTQNKDLYHGAGHWPFLFL